MTIEVEAPKPDRMAKAREAKAVKREAAAIVTPVKPVAEMTTEEVRAERQKLLDQLADLPNPDAIQPGLTPGTEVGQGPSRDKVPFSEAYFLKNFPLREVIAREDMTIKVNGVGFRVIKDTPCKLPEPHYAVYADSLRRAKQNDEQFTPPENPGRTAGYISPVHKIGVGFFHTAEQADSIKS